MSEKRQLNNWLKSYMDYVENTESAKIYKTWVGISVIASVLRRKVSFKLGRITIYPNLYVILVGPPGARKSQAIKFGYNLVKELTGITISADAPTREALIQDLDQSAGEFVDPSEDPTRHCSMTVISSELETFLGGKKDNQRMLATLTDLWDCPDEWRYRTKGSGTNNLQRVFLTLLGATTPNSIANCIPAGASGTGFTSRIIFCFSDKKHKKVPIPEETDEILKLRNVLIKDLDIISRMVEEYTFSKEGNVFWADWYNDYHDVSAKRICQDVMFAGWYERKPTFIIKLSLIIAAANGNYKHIKPWHMEEAIRYIEASEHCMNSSFSGVGRSEIAVEVDLVTTLIEAHGTITEEKLMKLVWKDIDAKKLDNVMDTIIKTGVVERKLAGVNIIYSWKGKN